MRYNAVTDSIAHLDITILDAQINNDSARELGPLMYISTLTNQPMDKIINWFMMLIIFVFDPLAIAMVVAANMAFSKLKPKVEASLPEGAEWGKSYPLEESASIEEQAKHTDWEEEAKTDCDWEEKVKKEVVVEKEVIKEEPKIPKKPYVSSWGSPGGNR